MNNVSEIKNCYGCGVCGLSCPKRIIDIRLNDEGFYEPYIVDMSKCTYCGLCMDCCSFLHDSLSLTNYKVKCYAAWSNDNDIRKKCSSGGIGFEIGKYLLNSGYKACGVKYNIEKNRAEHFIANNIKEYLSSVGSKYIQSYTVDAFCNINKKEKNLVVGTPCQIDSLRRYLQKKQIEKNFVLMDFFCHGIPTMNLWTKYLSMVEKKIGKVINVVWRDKSVGWQSSYNVIIQGENGIYNSKANGERLFYDFFLSNTCLGNACYSKCKYKYIKSSADIRIGDLWGKKYSNVDKGVSTLLTFTEKGHSVVEQLSDCELEEQSLETIMNGQIKNKIKKPFLRYLVIEMLKMKRYRLSFIAKIVHLQLLLKAFRTKILSFKIV